jgi:hypothetical protein
MNKKQKRMKKAVEYMQNYINTYDKQTGYLDYSDDCFILDMIYGIGLALDSKDYEFADGFNNFKKVVVELIKEKSDEHK